MLKERFSACHIWDASISNEAVKKVQAKFIRYRLQWEQCNFHLKVLHGSTLDVISECSPHMIHFLWNFLTCLLRICISFMCICDKLSSGLSCAILMYTQNTYPETSTDLRKPKTKIDFLFCLENSDWSRLIIIEQTLTTNNLCRSSRCRFLTSAGKSKRKTFLTVPVALRIKVSIFRKDCCIFSEGIFSESKLIE